MIGYGREAGASPQWGAVTQRSAVFRVVLVMFAGLAWCGLTIAARTFWTWNLDYAFLVWNLGLAVIPLVLSTLLVWRRGRLSFVLLGSLWLLFLPNAPYIVTDFIHLRTLDSGPLWLDVLVLSSCAATGLLFAYWSIAQIQGLFIRVRKPLLGWSVAIGALFLSGVGIYLGRFLRWRSMDAFRDPMVLLGDVLERVLNPAVHYRAWGVSLGFGLMLAMGYAAFLAAGWMSQAILKVDGSRLAQNNAGAR